MKATTTLYRPVGPGELRLIEALGWRAFVPRPDEPPVFYPASALPYAEAIASGWNLADSGEG